MLYKLMAMHAASCVCELRPALNVPNQSLELSENKSSFVVVVGVEICYNIVCPCVGTL
jgi:hypothetical protein